MTLCVAVVDALSLALAGSAQAVVNRRTTRALGLAVPPAVVLRAREVIE